LKILLGEFSQQRKTDNEVVVTFV